jgi:hypothetical protein
VLVCASHSLLTLIQAHEWQDRWARAKARDGLYDERARRGEARRESFSPAQATRWVGGKVRNRVRQTNESVRGEVVVSSLLPEGTFGWMHLQQ